MLHDTPRDPDTGAVLAPGASLRANVQPHPDTPAASLRCVDRAQDYFAMDMTPHFPIYMDYGATTPCDGRVVDAMIPWLREHFGNPASRSHPWGWEAEEAVEKARVQVAELIGADPREIVWTSGATESNNLAIKGAAQFYKTRGKHIVTVKTEHKAVLDTVRELERQGFDATYLDVEPDGLLDLGKFKAALRPDTILASVMLVNNEIGVIQDVTAIGKLCQIGRASCRERV